MVNITASTGTDDLGTTFQPVIRSLHHLSFCCVDAEETRRFYEDFLGFEFCAAIRETLNVGGAEIEALQVMFRMADGSFFTFYDLPHDIKPDLFKPIGPFDLHLAMKVSSEAEWMKWIERVKDAGIAYAGPLDHEFIRSIYFNDPNGLNLEITYQVPEHEQIVDRERAHVKDSLDAWTAKTAAEKEEYFRRAKIVA